MPIAIDPTRRAVLAGSTLILGAAGAPLTSSELSPKVAGNYELLLRYEQWLYREHWNVADACDRNAVALVPGSFDPAIIAAFGRNSEKAYEASPKRAALVLSAAGVSLAPDPLFDLHAGHFVEPRRV